MVLRYEKQDGNYLVFLEGDVDMFSVYSVRKQFMSEFNEAPADLILDLKQVKYIDSSGIGFLIELKKTLEESNLGYTIRNIPTELMKLFTSINLVRLLKNNIESSPEEA